MDITDHDLSGYIAELISQGYSSLNREEGQASLASYKTIESGLRYMKNNVSVDYSEISKCVVILKLLVDIREHVIRSTEVLDSQIPNIYTSVENLNKLLIKSANETIKDDDRTTITTQCEEFLKAADVIRRDPKLKGLGVLDGNMKNVIGRLRKKSNIESVFKDKNLEFYEQITNRANEILKAGDLQQIGEEIIRLKSEIDMFAGHTTYQTRLTNYIRRFEKGFIKRIKSQLNRLYKSGMKVALFDIQEIIDTITAMEDLIKYHRNKGLNLHIKRIKKKIENERFTPTQDYLSRARDFVLNGIQSPYWKDYEALYLKKNRENEIFLDKFYDYTLKGIPPKEASELLKNKIQKLKKISLNEFRFISIEQDFENELNRLIQFFKSQR